MGMKKIFTIRNIDNQKNSLYKRKFCCLIHGINHVGDVQNRETFKIEERIKHVFEDRRKLCNRMNYWRIKK